VSFLRNSDSQEIPRFYGIRVHKSTPPPCILVQINTLPVPVLFIEDPFKYYLHIYL